MVNVRWVDEFETKVNKEDVICDYLAEEIKVEDILTKYNLSMNEFVRIRDEGTDYRRTGKCKIKGTPKNYHYCKKTDDFKVTKTIDKKKMFFGAYIFEEDAQKVVEYLRNHDWKYDGLKEFELANDICKKKRTGKNYCRVRGNRYAVYKTIDKKRNTYGEYRSPREAELIVERLDACGWDKSQLDKIKEEVKKEMMR